MIRIGIDQSKYRELAGKPYADWHAMHNTGERGAIVNCTACIYEGETFAEIGITFHIPNVKYHKTNISMVQFTEILKQAIKEEGIKIE